MSFKGLQQFASRYDGKTLSEEDLRSMLTDFNPQVMKNVCNIGLLLFLHYF